jgi:hypothetical protein
MRPITIEEVDLALHDTPEGKSLGPNGFTSDFFHHCLIRKRIQKPDRA